MAEIRRIGEDERTVGVLMAATGLSRPFGHPAYHAIYAAAAELDLPIVVHAGGDTVSRHALAPDGRRAADDVRRGVRAGVQPDHDYVQSFIVQGVFEKFPDLRVFVSGAGTAWIPGLFFRLDVNWRGLRREVPWVRRPPSEYFREHVRVGTWPLDKPTGPHGPQRLVRALNAFGNPEDLLCFASGYPSWDTDTVVDVAARLPASWHARVFHDNAAEWFRWSGAARRDRRRPDVQVGDMLATGNATYRLLSASTRPTAAARSSGSRQMIDTSRSPEPTGETSFDPAEIRLRIEAVGRDVTSESLRRSRAVYAPFHEREPYAGVTVVRDVAYGLDERQRMDLFTPAAESGCATRPAIVFLHGGGFVAGDRRKHSSSRSQIEWPSCIWASSSRSARLARSITGRCTHIRTHSSPRSRSPIRGRAPCRSRPRSMATRPRRWTRRADVDFAPAVPGRWPSARSSGLSCASSPPATWSRVTTPYRTTIRMSDPGSRRRTRPRPRCLDKLLVAAKLVRSRS